MVGHGGSSASSYLADPTSPLPSHCASIAATSTLRVNYVIIQIIPVRLFPLAIYITSTSKKNSLRVEHLFSDPQEIAVKCTREIEAKGQDPLGCDIWLRVLLIVCGSRAKWGGTQTQKNTQKDSNGVNCSEKRGRDKIPEGRSVLGVLNKCQLDCVC